MVVDGEPPQSITYKYHSRRLTSLMIAGMAYCTPWLNTLIASAVAYRNKARTSDQRASAPRLLSAIPLVLHAIVNERVVERRCSRDS